MKTSYVLILILFLISSSAASLNFSPRNTPTSAHQIASKIVNEIEIPAGTDYCIQYDSETQTLIGEEPHWYADGLSDICLAAIVKSPTWIQRNLTRQFQSLDNPEEYAELILEASKQYTDEIAFTIACSPLSFVPSVDVILDNTIALYEHDEWICYADIVDYDQGDGNFYSTIRYRVLENESVKEFEYPKEIYYWYVVQPKTLSENAEYIYDKIWREYLFYHNDLGYPLLKEKLSNLEYLWDCQSYSQPANRLWKSSIKQHPTAIEAISYWIGKTVPYEAVGDRPPQPNTIAHQHNGYCGELQRLAVAAQRTALIPSVGVCNIGEDHVWREFYERGWHQNDNWWTDSGGIVDQPDIYQYGWGKEMSTVFAWNGDDSIYQVTPTYIHADNRSTVTFVVTDSYRQPIDGVRVTATVVGIKDISWLQYQLLEIIQSLWDRLPDFFKGTLLQTIYDRFTQRIENLPEIIDGLTVTTWGYTDINGECSLELGRNHEYLFVIQQGKNLRKPWQLAKNNALRILNNTQDKTFYIPFIDISNRIPKHTNTMIPQGDCVFDISFETQSYQIQKNVKNDGMGIYNQNAGIDCFIVDQQNYEKYKDGKRFSCHQYRQEQSADYRINTVDKDWYLIFRNHAYKTNVVLDFTIEVQTQLPRETVEIVTPSTTIFNHPLYTVGDTIYISGIATDDIVLLIDNQSISVPTIDGEWSYLWNTSEAIVSTHLISATSNDAYDECYITLLDDIPPKITIRQPEQDAIIESNSLYIAGSCWDNNDLETILVAIDDSEFIEATGTQNWSITWDITDVDLGDHCIVVKAVDHSENKALCTLPFVKNQSGHQWNPAINDFYHLPQNPINTSNVIIYANVTTTSPFDISSVTLYYSNSTQSISSQLYEYANNPIQPRHEEDPLVDEPNTPLFGIELGHFQTGEQISYWIVASDTANNSISSNQKSFIIA